MLDQRLNQIEREFGEDIHHYTQFKKYPADDPVCIFLWGFLSEYYVLKDEHDIYFALAVYYAELDQVVSFDLMTPKEQQRVMEDILQSDIDWCQLRYKKYRLIPLRSRKEYHKEITNLMNVLQKVK